MMSECQGDVFEALFVVTKAQWLSANGREHWAVKSRKTKGLRARARVVFRGYPPLGSVHVTAWVQYPTNGRSDPANAYPTVKALVDGMVDAGVIPDDSSKFLAGPDMRRDEGLSERGTHRIRLVIEKRADDE